MRKECAEGGDVVPDVDCWGGASNGKKRDVRPRIKLWGLGQCLGQGCVGRKIFETVFLWGLFLALFF